MSSVVGTPSTHSKKPVLRRAAQYVRMSTDHQRYSIANQQIVISEYAICHEMEVVRTYADEGRSGVTMKGRDALKRLIADVQERRADFDVILVYDVSRWGRFQDADESAYYEFICKSAGISVVYCAEIFENNGTILATLIKVMKRAMAGEYSRELTAKVAHAHRYHAERGFHQGGPANYGLRRLLVDVRNQPKIELRDGEAKSLQGDRVRLIKGPVDEADTVREIFRLFVNGTPHRAIARHLNSLGLRTRRGNPWHNFNISKILKNEKYAGTFVYCCTSWPMLGGRIHIAPDKWVRVEDAIEPVVDANTFADAQRIMKDGWRFTDAELLNYLTAQWCTTGYLSAPRINKSKFTPTAVTYRKRFTSLLSAYKLIGYRTVHPYRYSRAGEHVRRTHRNLVCQLTSTTRCDASKIVFNEEKQVLAIDGAFDVAIVVLPYLPRCKKAAPGWKLHFNRLEECNVVLIMRMDKSNTNILDCHLVPRLLFDQPSAKFTEDTIKTIRRYKLRSLDTFYRASKKIVLEKGRRVHVLQQ